MATIYWRPGGKKHRPGATAYLNWSEQRQQFRVSLGKIAPREAEAIRGQKDAELEHGVKIIARDQLVRTYLDWYLDWYKGEHPTTHGKARSEVKRFIAKFGHRPCDSIEPTEIEDYKTRRLVDDKAAPETVGKELRRLKAAFKRGIGWNAITANPFASVAAPRGARSVAVKFYSAAQMASLYAANPERAPLWALIANTGMRRGEACKMRKADVVSGKLLIESIPDETGEGRNKSARWREVPLNKRALAALERLPDPIVAVHADTLGDWFAADAAAAGVGGSLHRLRHTFCAHLAQAGVPLRRIQLLAGHADYKTTEQYAHLVPAKARYTVDKLKF